MHNLRLCKKIITYTSLSWVILWKTHPWNVVGWTKFVPERFYIGLRVKSWVVNYLIRSMNAKIFSIKVWLLSDWWQKQLVGYFSMNSLMIMMMMIMMIAMMMMTISDDDYDESHDDDDDDDGVYLITWANSLGLLRVPTTPLLIPFPTSCKIIWSLWWQWWWRWWWRWQWRWWWLWWWWC